MEWWGKSTFPFFLAEFLKGICRIDISQSERASSAPPNVLLQLFLPEGRVLTVEHNPRPNYSHLPPSRVLLGRAGPGSAALTPALARSRSSCAGRPGDTACNNAAGRAHNPRIPLSVHNHTIAKLTQFLINKLSTFYAAMPTPFNAFLISLVCFVGCEYFLVIYLNLNFLWHWLKR